MQTARLYDEVHTRLKAQSVLKRIELTELHNALLDHSLSQMEKDSLTLTDLPEPNREDLEKGKIGK